MNFELRVFGDLDNACLLNAINDTKLRVVNSTSKTSTIAYYRISGCPMRYSDQTIDNGLIQFVQTNHIADMINNDEMPMQLMVIDNSTEGFDAEFIENFLRKVNQLTGLSRKNLVFLTSNLKHRRSKYAVIRHFLFWAYHISCQNLDRNPHIIPDRVFISLNRRMRLHRSVVVNELLEHGLDDLGYISYRKTDDMGLTIEDILGGLSKCNYRFTKLKDIPDDMVLDITSVETNPVAVKSSYYDRVILDLITETLTDSRVCFFSEKTFRALSAGKPFLLVGSPGQIEYLINMGFDVGFQHHYDGIECVVNRAKAVVSQLAEMVSEYRETGRISISYCNAHNTTFYPVFLKSNRYIRKIITNLMRRFVTSGQQYDNTEVIIQNDRLFSDSEHCFVYFYDRNGDLISDMDVPPGGHSLSRFLIDNHHRISIKHIDAIDVGDGRMKYLDIPYITWLNPACSEKAWTNAKYFLDLDIDHRLVLHNYFEANLSELQVNVDIANELRHYGINPAQVVLFDAADNGIELRQQRHGYLTDTVMVLYETFRNIMYRDVIARSHPVIKNTPPVYRFLCLNRLARPHRLPFWYYFFDSEKFKISLNDNIEFSIYLRDLKEFIPLADFNLARAKRSHKLLPHAVDDIPTAHNSVSIDEFLDVAVDCGIYLITETFFKNEGIVFFTEKIWKAVAGKKPFILVGEYHSLVRLRDKGFKTFSQFINEDYDEICDPVIRHREVIKEVNRILSLSDDEYTALLNNMTDIVEYNFKHFIDNDCRTKLRIEKK